MPLTLTLSPRAGRGDLRRGTPRHRAADVSHLPPSPRLRGEGRGSGMRGRSPSVLIQIKSA
ncbi:hypothetical protein CN116_06730 [Sinorhizobium meliloti]|nr:hypothetical protein DA101_011315 [Sinorhizobium meliloti]RVM06992.1 hypothetical protein CN125_20875 [Sinorhizobium meliloti]RVM48624.1 hypothetical protein CN121_10310 [Sinorhizobium meliloti]RVM64387.1 hypothetical protein CN124_17695 [Sinorhizobium meliloti]RVM69138.1 hypothetical protein CN123_11450 [Sinorhizobium meliloti]